MPLPTSIPSQKKHSARSQVYLQHSSALFDLHSPSLYCRLKLLLGNLGHSIAQQSTLHTVPRWNAGLVDCLQLPIPVHRLRNKLDSLHATVSVVVRTLWRSLEYSNQNLSNVTNFCAGLTTGVDCCQCILCIFVHLSTEATTRIFMPLASYELWAPHRGHYKF